MQKYVFVEFFRLRNFHKIFMCRLAQCADCEFSKNTFRASLNSVSRSRLHFITINNLKKRFSHFFCVPFLSLCSLVILVPVSRSQFIAPSCMCKNRLKHFLCLFFTNATEILKSRKAFNFKLKTISSGCSIEEKKK